MKSFLKNISVFVICVVLTYPLMIFISGYSPITKALKLNLNYRIGSYGHLFSRIEEAKQLNGDMDILFLGSSHSYRGFDPRNFPDKKTFNLGSSSQTPIQTKILLERYLDKINPKVVIYEVYPFTFAADGVESSLDLIANDKNDFSSLKMAFAINNVKTYNTLLYAGFVQFFDLNKGFTEPAKKKKDTYISGGYVENEMSYFKFDNYSENKWELKDEQMSIFNECLELLKSKNIKTILVFAPITPRLYNSYSNNDFVDSTYNSYNVGYYNFNKLMQLNDSLDFYDSQHLNQNGVEKFNKKLSETLKL